MIRNFLRYAALASIVSVGACDLAIQNPNAGETRRVLGSSDDAEALISTYYKRWSTGVYTSTLDLQGMANVMSLMNYSSLANSCQNSHLPFAGASNVNDPGNTCADEQSRRSNQPDNRFPSAPGSRLGGIPAWHFAGLPRADA